MSQETLLSHTKIWLFGRVLRDISIHRAVYANIPHTETDGNHADTPPQMSNNNFLFAQLSGAGAQLARIYAFSYEAGYYDLARPTIFLVHGEGIEPEGVSGTLTPDQRKLSRMPGETGRTGLATQEGSFAGGIKAWAYDRADFTIRLDMEGGSFDSLLLEAELNDWDMATRSAGSVARSAGSVARAAGSVARAAGSVARARRGSNGASD
jgi:hypothetical protein